MRKKDFARLGGGGCYGAWSFYFAMDCYAEKKQFTGGVLVFSKYVRKYKNRYFFHRVRQKMIGLLILHVIFQFHDNKFALSNLNEYPKKSFTVIGSFCPNYRRYRKK